MESELKKQLADAFGLLISNLSEAKDFVKGEAPGIACEIVRSETIKTLFVLFVSVVFNVLSLSAMYVAVTTGVRGDALAGIFLVSVVVAFISFIALCISTCALIDLWTAPRLYVINYIRHQLIGSEKEDS